MTVERDVTGKTGSLPVYLHEADNEHEHAHCNDVVAVGAGGPQHQQLSVLLLPDTLGEQQAVTTVMALKIFQIGSYEQVKLYSLVEKSRLHLLVRNLYLLRFKKFTTVLHKYIHVNN